MEIRRKVFSVCMVLSLCAGLSLIAGSALAVGVGQDPEGRCTGPGEGSAVGGKGSKRSGATTSFSCRVPGDW